MRFIVVEGLDGSGKDTQARLIEKQFISKGKNVIIRSHPESDNKYGIKAKKALLRKGKINYVRASVYYALDVVRSIRKYHREESDDTLIIVRYLVGVAYLPFPLAKILYKFFATFLPISQYMFFLDVAPEESMKRIEIRDKREMFENIEELSNVRKKSLKLIKGWHIIDGNRSIKETYSEINKILHNVNEE